MQLQLLVNMKRRFVLDDDDFSSWLLENSSVSINYLVDTIQKNLSSSVLTHVYVSTNNSVAKLDFTSCNNFNSFSSLLADSDIHKVFFKLKIFATYFIFL